MLNVGKYNRNQCPKPLKNPDNLLRIGLTVKFYTNLKLNQISLSLNKLEQEKMKKKTLFFLSTLETKHAKRCWDIKYIEGIHIYEFSKE